MNPEVTGKVKIVGETQTFGAKGFKKRQLILEVEDGAYTQEIPVDFVQDKVDLLDSFQAGQTVTVMYNLKGREWNGKWFSSVEGWKINVSGQSASTPAPAAEAPTKDVPADFDEYEDDIPF